MRGNSAGAADAVRLWPVETPVGTLRLAGDDRWLQVLQLPSERARSRDRGRLWTDERMPRSVELAEAQLEAYFAGELRRFELPLAPAGTAWQRGVWQALSEIPFGETASYAEIARRVGSPGAARAVGLANARNPIALIIPCHRVIGASGGLTGYGGGLALKAALLEHEREILARGASSLSRALARGAVVPLPAQLRLPTMRV